MRTTQKNVVAAFEALAHACGKRVARSAEDHGAWMLDYTACYGGYVIEQISETTSGVSHPFGSDRCKASEAWSKFWCAVRAIEIAKGVQS